MYIFPENKSENYITSSFILFDMLDESKDLRGDFGYLFSFITHI